MVIDANVYWLPDELFTDSAVKNAFIRTMPQEYGVRAVYYDREGGEAAIRIERPFGCENLNYFQNDYKMERQLADMDLAGVDHALLKLPGTQEWLSLELCRLFNDAAAKHVKESGGRMSALAVVPPYGDEESIAELERCIFQLGMKGVQVSAHYGNHYLDEEMFRSFFRKVNEMKIPVYVHHTPLPVDYASILPYDNLRRSFGRCQDQITAIGRELFSGMFAELPNLKMIHSMLGGAYYAFKEMLMPRDSGGGRFQTAGIEEVRGYLQQNIFFEMSHAQPWGKEGLKMAAQILGADHILYGSSYPVKQVWMTGGPDFVRKAGLSGKEQESMLFENASRLYGISSNESGGRT